MKSLGLLCLLGLVMMSSADVVRLTHVVVSDTTTTVVGPDLVGRAVATWVNSAWTAYIPGATWIWDSSFTTHPGNIETSTFTKAFYVAGAPVSGFLQIAAANEFTATVNNKLVACASAAADVAHTYAQVCEVSYLLQSGVNYLGVTVSHDAGSASYTAPAGLLFKLVYTSHLVT